MQFNDIIFENNNASIIQTNVTGDDATPWLQSDSDHDWSIPATDDTSSNGVAAFENVIIRDNNMDTYATNTHLIDVQYLRLRFKSFRIEDNICTPGYTSNTVFTEDTFDDACLLFEDTTIQMKMSQLAIMLDHILLVLQVVKLQLI